MKHFLIAYYSWSGNTAHIARIIEQKTGGRLFEISPVHVYTSNYSACVKQAKQEISKRIKPGLKNLPAQMNDIDTVFLGSPIWWYTMAPPVLTFLTDLDLSGKTIIPFCSHGGGGNGHFIDDVVQNCSQAKVLKDLTLYGNGGKNVDIEIDDWLKRLEGFKK